MTQNLMYFPPAVVCWAHEEQMSCPRPVDAGAQVTGFGGHLIAADRVLLVPVVGLKGNGDPDSYQSCLDNEKGSSSNNSVLQN